MPYSNVPKSLWGKMDRCVEQVKRKDPKANAYAVCFSSVVGEAAKGAAANRMKGGK